MLRFPPAAATIQEGIDARTKLIHQLELKVRNLDLERERATQECHKLAAEREALRTLLLPSHRLPAEILSQIFVAVHHATWRDSRQVNTLCRVCKLWRNIAIGTHQLWSNLELGYSHIHKCKIHNIFLWFERSGSLPRRLTLGGLYGRCSTDHATGSNCHLVEKATVARLLTQGPALDTLVFQEIPPDCLQELAKHMKEQQTPLAIRPWDSLKSLTISVSLRHLQDPPPLKQFLLHLPPVPSLQLSGLYHEEEQIQLLPTNPSVLGNLTTLSLRHLPSLCILALLPLCKNLEDLTLSPMDFYENTTANVDHYLVHLPYVRVLRLNHLAYETIAALPQLLRTPALVDFSVRFGDEDDFNSPLDSDESDEKEKPVTDHRTEMVTGLVSFIQQSKATVRRLLLRKLKISSRGLERLLSNTPSVTDLALISVTMVNTLFRPVKYAAPDVKYHLRLLPRLGSLRLCFMPDHFPYEEGCNFFIHRATSCPSIGRLKVLRLETNPETAEGYDSVIWADLRRAALKLSRLRVDVFVFTQRTDMYVHGVSPIT